MEQESYQGYSADDGMGAEVTRDTGVSPERLGAIQAPNWWEGRTREAKPAYQGTQFAAPAGMQQMNPYQYAPQMSLPAQMAMKRKRQMEQMMAQYQLGFGQAY